MKGAETLLMTSDWEGLPISLIEAMCLGVPSVVSDCSEGVRDLWRVTPDMMGDGDRTAFVETEYGVLVPSMGGKPASITDWVQAIEHVLEDGNRRSTYATACQHRANDYDIRKVQRIWRRQLVCL